MRKEIGTCDDCKHYKNINEHLANKECKMYHFEWLPMYFGCNRWEEKEPDDEISYEWIADDFDFAPIYTEKKAKEKFKDIKWYKKTGRAWNKKREVIE